MAWTWLGIVALGLLVFSACMGFRRGFVREVVSTFFIVLSLAAVWFINPYVNEFLKENTPVYERIQEGCQNLINMQSDEPEALDTSQQKSFIEGLALPGFVKTGIEENNTAEVYRYLAVDTFTDYVSHYLAVAVLNALSFLVSYLLATIIIRVITYALDILAKLPIIHGVNKAAGALLGGLKFIIFIWIALLVLTLFCNTEIGRQGLELVEGDTFLSFISEHNIFAKIFMNIFYGK